MVHSCQNSCVLSSYSSSSSSSSPHLSSSHNTQNTNMSSDFFTFDEPFYQHSTPPTMLNSDNPFSALSESSIDTILQDMAITDAQNTSDFNQITNNTLLSDSPPTTQQTHFSTGYDDYPVSAIETEDPPLFFGSSLPNSQSNFLGCQYGGCEAMFQRSYSHGSHSYEGEKPWFAFHPSFDALFQSSDFLCSPENGFSSAHIRRVFSTGDLQKVKNSQGESTLMEEANFKVGRYSADERKERIDRYRAKRNQRNFNKTIKYACRKTLADSRARVRGRFARNDEPGETPKSALCSNRYEDEDDILAYSWQEEEDVEIVGCGGGGDNDGGSAGGCNGGGQYMNYQFGASSELHQYSVPWLLN